MDDIAELARRRGLLHGDITRVVSQGMSHHQLDIVATRRVNDRLSVGESHRDRFFQKDVQPFRCRHHTRLTVKLVRSRDDDGIQSKLFQHFPIIGITRHAKLPCNPFGDIGLDVRYSHQFDAT